MVAGIEETAVTNAEHIECVNTLWTKTLREFLHVNNTKTEIPELTATHKKPQHNRPSITLLQNTRFSENKQKLIKTCWIWLQVT